MANQYVVAKGGSILISSGKNNKIGKILRAGCVITEGKNIIIDGVALPPMPRKKIEGHLRSGYLRHIGVLRDEGPISPNDFTDRAPGSVTHPPLPGPGREDALTEDKALKTEGGSVSTSSKPKQASADKTHQVTSKWTLDPEKLTGKSLDELNVMVSERDADVPAFSTAEEAVAWLSQDRAQVEAVTTKGGKKEGKDSQVATG